MTRCRRFTKCMGRRSTMSPGRSGTGSEAARTRHQEQLNTWRIRATCAAARARCRSSANLVAESRLATHSKYSIALMFVSRVPVPVARFPAKRSHFDRTLLRPATRFGVRSLRTCRTSINGAAVLSRTEKEGSCLRSPTEYMSRRSPIHPNSQPETCSLTIDLWTLGTVCTCVARRAVHWNRGDLLDGIAEVLTKAVSLVAKAVAGGGIKKSNRC